MSYIYIQHPKNQSKPPINSPDGSIQTLEPNMKFPQHLFSHDEIVRYEGWEELKNCVINHLEMEIT